MRCSIGSFPAAAASKIQGDLYLGFSALSLAALAKSRAKSFAAVSVLSDPDYRHRKDSGVISCLTFRVARLAETRADVHSSGSFEEDSSSTEGPYDRT